MTRLTYFRTRAGSSLVAAALFLATVVIPIAGSVSSMAEPAPIAQPTSSVVTSDVLPTPQINGVVWAQVIVGDTVYVGGSFTSARPYGSPAGSNEVTRSNLMAFSLSTGVMTSFAPVINQQVKTLAVSPDGTRLYAGGSFTSVNGVGRYRLAAFNVGTGALLTSFAAGVDYTINAVVATNSTVYIGGAFSSAGNQPRTRLAAFAASNGGLLNWAPTADGAVQAMIMAPANDKLIIGGSFVNVNSGAQRGTAALDLVTGVALPWALNTTVSNSGSGASILALSTDGTSIFGGGYKFGGSNTNTLEGVFRANASTGAMEWVEDCHGDTYGVFANAGAVYQVGHAHYCGNVMGWAQPNEWRFNRGMAFTKEATGTLIRDPHGYMNWNGTPAPSLYAWFPRLDVGTFTGKNQAAWTVTGNDNYVVLGGEFTRVNGTLQQGITAFALKSISGAKRGAELSGALFTPTLNSSTSGTVRVSFRANWDRDDRDLTYQVIRNGARLDPIYTTTVGSYEWERPAIGYTDTGLTPGATYTYRLSVTDDDGNVVLGDIVSTTVASAAVPVSTYSQKVAEQGATIYWPMNDTNGNTLDASGFNDGVLGVGASRVVGGAIGGVGDGAMNFGGSAGGDMATIGALVAPQTFTVSAWFKTTTAKGGRIIGFSDLETGSISPSSGHRDRQIYMNNAGRLSFGMWPPNSGSSVAVTSTLGYNDGIWHQAVASLSSAGMTLYVDGVLVASRADVTSGEKYVGHWRAGGDSTASYSNAGSSGYFSGTIDEVSVYPIALTSRQINEQIVAAGRPSAAPSDPYGAAVFFDQPTLYWRLADTTGSSAVDLTGKLPGTYQGTVAKSQAGAVPGGNSAVRFNGSNGYVSSNGSSSNPTVYSVEAWVKTTSTQGGKIIGFGSNRTSLSTSYDRHLYMQNDGKVVFGAASVASTITSPSALNDGQWHYLVGTQGAAGMVLYVDGQPVGTNAQTTPAPYTGYWRVGGDRTWGSTSSYLNGIIDEAAVYSQTLTESQVRGHFTAGGGLLPNVLPTAAFTVVQSGLVSTVDAGGSTDSDGVIESYAWDFGDGATATEATQTHAYAVGGTYTITLTVTDNRRGAVTKTDVATAVEAPNVAPVAAITAQITYLVASFDGAGSVDTDGSIALYDWNFGDGSTGTGITATHTYAAPGTYSAKLKVTDDDGAIHEAFTNVTVATNQNPVAVITSSSSGVNVSADGSGSSDDGSVAAYTWDFGDGASATGATATHAYATLGSYLVTLTVTDDFGLTSTATKQLDLTPAQYVSDIFERTVAAGWGASNLGGTWTLPGTPAASVSGGAGLLPISAGSTRVATLPAVGATDLAVDFALTLDKQPTGGSTNLTVSTRKVGNSEYRLIAVFNTAGKVTLQIHKVAGGISTTLKVQTIAGLNYTAGTALNISFQVAGTSTVTLSAKAWTAGSEEPTAWQAVGSDSTPTAPLQGPGQFSLTAYVSGLAPNAPVLFSFDDLVLQAP